MPMFEYKCTNCKHVEDCIRTYEHRDDPLPCVICGKTMQRVEVARTFFKLKGKGWTDRSAGMK